MDKSLEVIFSKNFIESTFKFLSYLTASVVILGAAKFSLHHEQRIAGIFFILFFFISVTQTFVYGLVNLVFPVGQSVWPNINYLEHIKFIRDQNKHVSRRILKVIFFSKPMCFLLICYFALFFVMNGVLNVFIQKI